MYEINVYITYVMCKLDLKALRIVVVIHCDAVKFSFTYIFVS